MIMDCISFEYTKKDGTSQTEDEFFSEHKDIVLTPDQKGQMRENLERQCTLVLKELGDKECIILTAFCEMFIFQDDITKEFYLKPLEIELGVFFKKVKFIIYIYDMRMVA